jgi:hypothetical protein
MMVPEKIEPKQRAHSPLLAAGIFKDIISG